MQTVSDYSYGAVPFNRETGEINIFLIHQYGSNGDVFWTFPKGHAEEGESPENAARREVSEETGLVIRTLYTDFVYTSSYSFQHNDVRINKTVEYFLAETAREYQIVEHDEVADAGWFTIKKAEALLTFVIAKDVLKQAVEDINHLYT
jgi:bis(5'-nucleosidyl)-tetraphosphatase